jgi:hypothetical protein
MAIKFSAFNLEEFGELEASQLVGMARLAEASERFEDMICFMKQRVEKYKDVPLNSEERNLMSVAYKNVIGARRASWRQYTHDIEGENSDEATVSILRDQVAEEILNISKDVLGLLEDILIKKGVKTEEQVFYQKMAGDYYRYLTESSAESEYKQKCKDYYTEAWKIAETELKATNPIRLGLALNFSVCFYEILEDPKHACDLAREAFDEAISKLDHLNENEYRDSTLIMQLLRDNLTLWTSNEKLPNEDEDNVTVEDLEN